MNKDIFIIALWFTAGVIAGYLLQPILSFSLWVLIYKVGNDILNWLYEKGILK